ncbi:hypothetical protein BS78_05G254400 [Paspalum vaginatum]|nr:hypothetical protein BS78_05G254400 [Paspalum vaginatum]
MEKKSPPASPSPSPSSRRRPAPGPAAVPHLHPSATHAARPRVERPNSEHDAVAPCSSSSAAASTPHIWASRCYPAGSPGRDLHAICSTRHRQRTAPVPSSNCCAGCCLRGLGAELDALPVGARPTLHSRRQAQAAGPLPTSTDAGSTLTSRTAHSTLAAS